MATMECIRGWCVVIQRERRRRPFVSYAEREACKERVNGSAMFATRKAARAHRKELIPHIAASEMRIVRATVTLEVE